MNLTINGVELELDMLDADVMEKFERQCNDVTEKVLDESRYQGLSTSEGMKLQCRIIDKFFDNLFGAGTAQALFGGNHNLGARLDTFGQVVSSAAADSSKKMDAITDKYGIARIQNREQRRHGGKQKYRNRDRRGRH